MTRLEGSPTQTESFQSPNQKSMKRSVTAVSRVSQSTAASRQPHGQALEHTRYGEPGRSSQEMPPAIGGKKGMFLDSQASKTVNQSLLVLKA